MTTATVPGSAGSKHLSETSSCRMTRRRTKRGLRYAVIVVVCIVDPFSRSTGCSSRRCSHPSTS